MSDLDDKRRALFQASRELDAAHRTPRMYCKCAQGCSAEAKHLARLADRQLQRAAIDFCEALAKETKGFWQGIPERLLAEMRTLVQDPDAPPEPRVEKVPTGPNGYPHALDAFERELAFRLGLTGTVTEIRTRLADATYE